MPWWGWFLVVLFLLLGSGTALAVLGFIDVIERIKKLFKKK